MSANGNRGVTLPSALIRQTPAATPRRPESDPDAEPADDAAEGADAGEGQGGAREPRPSRARRARKPAAEGPGQPRKLTLPDDVYERLRLQAMQKKTTASAIAAEILNRGLPRFRVEREG